LRALGAVAIDDHERLFDLAGFLVDRTHPEDLDQVRLLVQATARVEPEDAQATTRGECALIAGAARARGIASDVEPALRLGDALALVFARAHVLPTELRLCDRVDAKDAAVLAEDVEPEHADLPPHRVLAVDLPLRLDLVVRREAGVLVSAL